MHKRLYIQFNINANARKHDDDYYSISTVYDNNKSVLSGIDSDSNARLTN